MPHCQCCHRRPRGSLNQFSSQEWHEQGFFGFCSIDAQVGTTEFPAAKGSHSSCLDGLCSHTDTAEECGQKLTRFLSLCLCAVVVWLQMYKSTGLIGIMGTTSSSSSSAAAAADALTQKLQGLSSANEAQLTAAKQLALGGYQSAISAKGGVVQDMGLQLLSRGKFSAKEYASAVSGLTAADVSKYVSEVVKTPMTLVAVGGLASLPKYDTVAGRLKA